MQIGRLEMIDQAKGEYIEKVNKIQETDEKVKVDPDEKYKNAQSQLQPDKNDVILDNVKFGYNPDTKEFFVRITKGDTEYQYPTEDMMKLKKSLMEAYKQSQNL
ncbi:MAG: flagellin [Campylobacterales bacterium]|nr:flagellin [Campylobacterales bacterium]